jgi:RNA polymerase-binding transcription factor DksA
MNDNEPTVEQRIAFLKDAAEKMEREADEAEMELLRTPTDARLRKRVAALRKLSDDALDKVEELREENG